MRAADGLGIAGPQVGISKRIFVIDFGYLDFVKAEENGEKPKSAEFRPIAFINPEITEKEGKIVYGEGCLSVPKYNADVERAETIVCKYFDIDGNPQEIKANGLTAVAIQHENDHLDGVLFIDKISSLKRGIALKKVKKFLGAVRENGSKTETALYGKE